MPPQGKLRDATVEETLDAFDKRAEQAPTTTDTDLYRTLVREGRRAVAAAPRLTPALFEAGNDERVPIRGLEQGTDMLTRVLREAVG